MGGPDAEVVHAGGWNTVRSGSGHGPTTGSAASCSAGATRGWTSPRDPIVDTDTRNWSSLEGRNAPTPANDAGDF